MGVFKRSSRLSEELMQLIRNFWWDDNTERRHIHWTSWDNLTKEKGLELFNQALLLAKQAWRLIAVPGSLCSRLLKAKCFFSGWINRYSFHKESISRMARDHARPRANKERDSMASWQWSQNPYLETTRCLVGTER
jgi:hypothetical protein